MAGVSSAAGNAYPSRFQRCSQELQYRQYSDQKKKEKKDKQ
jgi:hypothetical protein